MSDTESQYQVKCLSPGSQSGKSELVKYAQAIYKCFSIFILISVLTGLSLNRTEFPPKLDRYNEEGFFDWGRTWDSKAVEAALRDGLDPDIFWTKDDLVSTRGAIREEAWTHWNTPLHLAIRASDHDSAEMILRYGGNVNIYNHQGHTPLHEAIDHRKFGDIPFLIRHGADPNKPSRDGHVPLHLALRDGNEELFFDLLEHGASLQAAEHFAWSVADLALMASERGILARLMSDEHSLLPTPMLTHSEPCGQTQGSTFAAAASEVLAVSLSDRVFPPKDLYETYQFLLRSLHIPRRTSWEAEAVDSLIESFISSLHKSSNVPSLAANEKFCPACLKFQSVAARSCRGRMTSIDRSSESIEIHKNKAELEQCALGGCPLCALMADWLYDKSVASSAYTKVGGKRAFRQVEDISCLDSSPIILHVDERFNRPPEELPRRVTSVYARRGNAASKAMSFDLEGFDVSFGLQEDESSRIHSTGSSRALGVAKQWLEDCRTSPAHSLCREAYRKISSGPLGQLPTRVLHVGSDHRDPYLFESNGTKATYCILSYCWGSPGDAITTKSNISERRKGIPLTSLPTLLREAVLTARALGFDYIWIDALCIIQDDEEDWAREASVMHELYSRADLTITSLVAADSRDDLFQSRPRRVCRPIPMNFGHVVPKRERPPFKEGSVVELAVHPDLQIARETAVRGPVHQRAWILQEQAMSTRLLYFGAGLLHWECLHDYLLEPYPSGYFFGDASVINSSFYKNRRRKLVIKGLPPLEDLRSSREDPFEVWQAQVQEFTTRQMTKRSDRIPAFLAISKSLEMALQDEFVGGIWKGEDRLLESLCWKLRQPDTTDPWGPTWTWASRSGETSYDSLRHEGKKTRIASIISCDVGADRSQSHVFGSITLKGTLALVQDGFFFTKTQPDYDHESGAKGYCCTLDMIAFGKDPPRTQDPMVTVFSYPEPDRHGGIVRLLLQPINGNGDFRTASAFRRVGIEFRPWRDFLTYAEYWEREQAMENRLKMHLLYINTSQPMESEDDISGPRSGTLNGHANRQQPDSTRGTNQDIPAAVEDEARLEETLSNSSGDDLRKAMEAFWRKKNIEFQTDRIVTIF